MENITEVFKLDKKFPFTIFKGKGVRFFNCVNVERRHNRSVIIS